MSPQIILEMQWHNMTKEQQDEAMTLSRSPEYVVFCRDEDGKLVLLRDLTNGHEEYVDFHGRTSNRRIREIVNQSTKEGRA